MVNFEYMLKHELTIPQPLNQNERSVHLKKGGGVEEFAERLKVALEAAGIKTRGSGAFLARLTGVTPKAASKWLNGYGRPTKENLERIADRCAVRAEWLEYGVGPMKVTGNVEFAPDYRGRKMAPVISWVQAGSWEEACDEFHPGDGDDWEEVSITTGDAAFWLRVRGDSMTAPVGTSVPEGSLILVDPAVSVDNGRLVVAKLTDSEEVTFKRLVMDGGRKYLKPLNPAYPVLEVNSNCRIVGVVIESKQKH